MKDFNSNRRPGPSGGGFGKRNFSGGGGGGGGFGGRKFGGGGGFGGRDSGRPEMHHAVCDSCGKSCEVPFRPTGDKPVYCRDCFGNGGKQSGGNFGKDNFQSRSFSKPGSEDRQMHHAVCAGCGDDCEVPFKPMGGKPVYCSNCFGKSGKAEGAPRPVSQGSDQMQQLHSKVDELKAQIEKLSGRLDRFLRADAPVFSQKEMTMAQMDQPKKTESKKDVKETPKQEKKAQAKPAAPQKAEKSVAKKASPAKKAVKATPVKKPAAKKVSPAKKAPAKKKK